MYSAQQHEHDVGATVPPCFQTRKTEFQIMKIDTSLQSRCVSARFARATISRLAVVGLLTGALVPVQGALAEQLSQSLDITPGRAISAAETRVLSREAAHVVRQIAKARSAINEADVGAAKAALSTARTSLVSLQNDMPTATVRDHIWAAEQHLGYDSTQKVQADLVPVFSDLEDIRGVVAVDVAKKHLQQAVTKLKAGDKEGARKEFQQASDSLVYTQMELPVSITLEQVDNAYSALDTGDLGRANAALVAAEDGLLYISTVATAPIGKARTSLWQATKDYTAKDYAATKRDLAAAGKWLDKVGASTDKTTREEAAKLKADTAAMNGKIAKGTAETGADLSGLWARTKALSDREAERTSAAWDRTWTKSAAKLSLIDAKLHLAYAQTAAFVSGTSAEVGAQLDKAAADLTTAAKQAGAQSNKKLADSIAALKASIASLKADASDTSASAKAHYDKVMSDLRQAIRDM